MESPADREEVAEEAEVQSARHDHILAGGHCSCGKRPRSRAVVDVAVDENIDAQGVREPQALRDRLAMISRPDENRHECEKEREREREAPAWSAPSVPDFVSEYAGQAGAH